MTLVLPFPPSTNRYWRNVRGRVLVSRAGRDYRSLVQQEALVARPVRFYGQPVNVTIRAYMPDARRRDVDNLLKASLDAMQHAGVYDDDSQIQRLTIERVGIDRQRPRLEVTIQSAEVIRQSQSDRG